MYRKSDNLFIYFKITKFISSCFDKESILLSHLLHIVLAICKFADAIDVPGTINSFIFSILSVFPARSPSRTSPSAARDFPHPDQSDPSGSPDLIYPVFVPPVSRAAPGHPRRIFQP